MIGLQVLIETHLNIEGSRNMQCAYFNVNNHEFKEDEEFSVAVAAYEWIQNQWKEYGYRNMVIDRVLWNKENDITKVVRQIVPMVTSDNLPF